MSQTSEKFTVEEYNRLLVDAKLDGEVHPVITADIRSDLYYTIHIGDQKITAGDWSDVSHRAFSILREHGLHYLLEDEL